MALNWPQWLAGGSGERPFDAFQIEVTTRCNLRCVTCPVTVLSGQWPNLDLPWTTFLRLADAFPRTKWVHLQGWGEPLLHRRIFDMLELAKAAGCRVGTTTNGTRLTLAAAERLITLGLDVLAVSIGGASATTHEAIRAGSDFAKLLANLRAFTALRAKRRATAPRLELLFLMTRSNLAELPAAVELAADIGADELVATNLDYAITPALEAERAASLAAPPAAHRELIERARTRARARAIDFRASALAPREVAVCDLNPLRILYIAVDGSVSPCVYLGVTAQHEIPRRFDGRDSPVAPVRFGNLNEQELLEIWESEPCRAFRRHFSERLLGVARIAAAGASRAALAAELPAAPEPCRACPKLYGL